MPDRAPAAYEIRCPHCHALQFLARAPWECVAIDEASISIKCWRRTCKHVLGLRLSGKRQSGKAALLGWADGGAEGRKDAGITKADLLGWADGATELSGVAA